MGALGCGGQKARLNLVSPYPFVSSEVETRVTTGFAQTRFSTVLEANGVEE